MARTCRRLESNFEQKSMPLFGLPFTIQHLMVTLSMHKRRGHVFIILILTRCDDDHSTCVNRGSQPVVVS